jgi:hypothetical protein
LPENEEDLEIIRNMEENQEIDTRESFSDDPESFGKEKDKQDLKELRKNIGLEGQ